MGTSSLFTLEDRINGVMQDGPDILYRLSRLNQPADQPIEIVSELPAAPDPDILMGYVMRWREIEKHFDKELRVYAWSYNTEVEKCVLGCVQNMSRICVTVLPMYLKENKRYGE